MSNTTQEQWNAALERTNAIIDTQHSTSFSDIFTDVATGFMQESVSKNSEDRAHKRAIEKQAELEKRAEERTKRLAQEDRERLSKNNIRKAKALYANGEYTALAAYVSNETASVMDESQRTEYINSLSTTLKDMSSEDFDSLLQNKFGPDSPLIPISHRLPDPQLKQKETYKSLINIKTGKPVNIREVGTDYYLGKDQVSPTQYVTPEAYKAYKASQAKGSSQTTPKLHTFVDAEGQQYHTSYSNGNFYIGNRQVNPTELGWKQLPKSSSGDRYNPDTPNTKNIDLLLNDVQHGDTAALYEKLNKDQNTYLATHAISEYNRQMALGLLDPNKDPIKIQRELYRKAYNQSIKTGENFFGRPTKEIITEPQGTTDQKPSVMVDAKGNLVTPDLIQKVLRTAAKQGKLKHTEVDLISKRINEDIQETGKSDRFWNIHHSVVQSH